MDGILNILKPPGMTSFDVVGYLRGLLKIKKIGHTGTLDPGAVGVLPVCIGSATKAIEYMTESDKIYRAELTLGASTDTQDSYGKILDQREVKVSRSDIMKAADAFTGKISQIPPMYSAIKIEGKKLYELARSGITVERKPRDVEIFSIGLISDVFGASKENVHKVLMDVHCSKGTYIRTLCNDIGEMLGCGGHMSFLIRVKAGSFHIDSALTLQEISRLQEKGELEEKLLKPDKVLLEFGEISLSDSEEGCFLNGGFLKAEAGDYKEGDLLRVYNRAGNFLALGEIIERQGKLFLKSKKVF